MSVRFAASARRELLDAIRWYQKRSPGLGNDLYAEVERALQQIGEFPRAWPIVDDDVRQFRLWRFPYAVIYRPEADYLYVLAVAHLHRRPGFWRDRL